MGLLLLKIIAVIAGVELFYTWVLFRFFSRDPRADEIHFVTTGDGWQIRLCRYRAENGGGEPVLLCHGAFSNQFSLSSPEGDALVDVLTDRGFDCWVIELRGTRSSLAPYRMSRFEVKVDDYLLEDFPAAIEYICGTTGHRQVHWVGHSLGGLLMYAYELIHGRDRLASGASLGSPPGFDGVQLWHPEYLIAFVRKFPRFSGLWQRAAGPLLPIFKLRFHMLPINWKNMHPKVGVACFFNMPELLPPRVADELARASSTNTWLVNHGAVDVFESVGDLKAPLLTVYAALDPLASPARGQAFFEALSMKDRRLLVLSKAEGHFADYNHVDLVFGRFGRVDVFEPVAEWFAAHPVTAKVAPSVDDAKLPATKKPRKRAARAKAAGKKTAAKAKKKAPSRKKPPASKKRSAKTKAKKKKPAKPKSSQT